ncbi:hypothetical protein LCGC14_1783190 [marine sediment metagenome]|uniref:Uncharacterized protein n=1 Tax=marine sediment metagenome TaxID=412755 RepID=A0A0F9HHB8_9ZZZZ
MILLGYLALRFRKIICKYIPKLAIWIYSKHRGECNGCGDCCKTINWNCEHLINNKCNIYEKRPLNCTTAPFPFDLWFNEKFKNCSIYYFQKRRSKEVEKAHNDFEKACG